MHDLDVLNAAQIVETVKERWRQLALTAHPDVPGGSAERFLELRDSYRMLLRVAKSRASSWEKWEMLGSRHVTQLSTAPGACNKK